MSSQESVFVSFARIAPTGAHVARRCEFDTKRASPVIIRDASGNATRTTVGTSWTPEKSFDGRIVYSFFLSLVRCGGGTLLSLSRPLYESSRSLLTLSLHLHFGLPLLLPPPLLFSKLFLSIFPHLFAVTCYNLD